MSDRLQRRVTVISHQKCLLHDTGTGHPECPARYEAVMSGLRMAEFASQIDWLEAQPTEVDNLQRCHGAHYIELVRREITRGEIELSTGDTAISPQSFEVATLAAGAACQAVDAVMRQPAGRAFCVVRPPGHHAAPSQGMGFCIFNNVAVATRYAQQRYGVERALIVDWDVHHGNGTQDFFYDDPSVLFFSTHQSPWYPGTGAAEETGTGRGLGLNINCPLPAGSGREEILAAFTDRLLPTVERFKPELVLISAGFDSRHGDPLGRFTLHDEDFAELTQLMIDLANRYAEGRIVSVLEGGYHLGGLSRAAAAHVQALLDS